MWKACEKWIMDRSGGSERVKSKYGNGRLVRDCEGLDAWP